MFLTARPLSLPNAALMRVREASVRLLRSAGVLLAVVAMLVAPALQAQDVSAGKATLVGTITDLTTGSPVPSVTVKVAGLGLQVRTGEDGKYKIEGLSIGATVVLDASRLGYSPLHEEGIRLETALTTRDLKINSNVMALDAITTSATSDPTTGVKMPMAVTVISSEQMPVPNMMNGALSIAGKVAGVTITAMSGRPGDSSIVQIGAIMSPFKDNAPLYVVDGVPLINTTNTSGDFGGLDIESVEIIRGAAAASLYGSRASGGVISITTKRGKDVAVGNSQIELFQTYGTEDQGKLPARRQAHYYKVNEYGQWLQNNGSVVDLLTQSRQAEALPFQDALYPFALDQVHQAMIGNRNLSSRVAVTQSTATTNLNISFSRARQPGSFRYNEGSTNRTMRFYVSHQLRDNLSLDASVNHTRGNTRNTSPSSSFTSLFQREPYVNLLTPNFDKRLPDFAYTTYPDTNDTNYINPLYAEWRYNYRSLRARNTFSTQLQYRPYNWLTLRGDFGYDKSDNNTNNYTQPGFPTFSGVGSGAITYNNSQGDGFDYNVTAQVLRDIGRLTTTLTLKGHEERQSSLSFDGAGTPIGLGSETLTNATSISVGSSTSETRISSVSANLKGDYGGKYIGDVLILHEGNSRFGPDKRWNDFWRAAGSWLISEESWYPSMLSKLTLAKVRASFGSAGGAPGFSDQYEEVGVSNTIGFTRGTLGNPSLNAEKRYDLEVGADLIWNSKISFQTSYRRQTLKDAIVPGVAPAISGYNSFTANLGETRGETYEATIEGTVLSTKIKNRNFRWRTNFVAAHSKSTIVDLGRPCYGINSYHPVCDGAPITAIWGLSLVESYDQLDGSYEKYRDWWERNDDGYLVPVGPGNHYWEGVSKGLWGTALTFELGEPSGATEFRADWGVPQIQRVDSVGGTSVRSWHKLGDSQQFMDYGMNHQFTFGNFSGAFQVAGAIGGDIWVQYIYDMVSTCSHPMVDQYKKADSLKKPTYYYGCGSGAPGGGDAFSGLQINNNGYGYNNNILKKNWAKLKEAQFGYGMNNRQYRFLNKMGVSRVNLSAAATNLFTFTTGGYPGLDPEGSISRRGDGYFRYDTLRYPLTRQYRGQITVVF